MSIDYEALFTDEDRLAMVKDRVHSYESISLANDDVVHLLIVIKHLKEQLNKLKGN